MRTHLFALLGVCVLALALIGCPPVSHQNIYEGSAAAGDDDAADDDVADDDVADDDVADDDVADDDAAGDACAELCEEICACQGADHYFEMMGYESCSEGCNDLYSGLDDKACEMALVTWLDAGGCDQYLP